MLDESPLLFLLLHLQNVLCFRDSQENFLLKETQKNPEKFLCSFFWLNHVVGYLQESSPVLYLAFQDYLSTAVCLKSEHLCPENNIYIYIFNIAKYSAIKESLVLWFVLSRMEPQTVHHKMPAQCWQKKTEAMGLSLSLL